MKKPVINKFRNRQKNYFKTEIKTEKIDFKKEMCIKLETLLKQSSMQCGIRKKVVKLNGESWAEPIRWMIWSHFLSLATHKNRFLKCLIRTGARGKLRLSSQKESGRDLISLETFNYSL